MVRIPQSFVGLTKKKGLQLIANLEASLEAAAGTKGYLEKGDLDRHYSEKFGSKALDKHLKTFQPEIDKVLGRAS